MKIDKLPDTWLYETHSKEQISEWANGLKYFYFFRAWGGHANDGDSFKASIKFSNRQDLIDKLSKLGITLATIPADHPRPVIGKSYTHEEYKRFKNEIKDFPDLEQHSHRLINGSRCFVWAEKGSISFSVFGEDGDLYSSSQADFETCKNIESSFDKAGFQDQKDNSLESSVCCISKTKYPELFN